MCFMLFAGTTKPLPRKEWKQEAPCVYTEALSEDDAEAKQYFTLPEVQYIGSAHLVAVVTFRM
jgi:hypothetical protein